MIVHNMKKVKSKLENCCIRENKTISSFELRLKKLFLYVEVLKGKLIPMNKKLGYIQKSMLQQHWETFQKMLKVEEWNVELLS